MGKTGKKNSRPFSLRFIVFSILICSIILIVMMFGHTIFLTNTYRQINDCNAKLLACSTGVMEMEQTGTYLSQQAYLYIQHQEQAYLDQYFDTVNLRMESELNNLRSQSLTPSDDEALTAANELYGFIRSRDIYAMKLVAVARGLDAAQQPEALRAVSLIAEDAALSPEQMIEKARELLCDGAYAQAYKEFYAKIGLFRDSVVQNLRQRLTDLNSRAHMELAHEHATMLLLMLLNLITGITAVRGILRPLESCIASIQKGEPVQVDGVHELQQMAVSYNETYSRNVENQKKLRLRAERDPMTGLLNQGTFGVLKQQLESCKDKLGLLMIDVDYFKHINDAFGHEVGNDTLKKIASMLVNSVRPEDFVIRYGGDEFVVVMLDVTKENAEMLEQKINQINESLQQPDDSLPSVSLSVGASFSETGFHERLFQQADQAMYEVKRKGRCGFAVYQESTPELEIEAASPAEQSKPSILLVDDSEMNRDILCSMLEDQYEVFQVSNGLQAIEEIGKKGHTLTAVLLDLVMPVCDGYEVLAYMKKHRWHEILPVIIISSETDPTCINRAYDLGAMDFIGRPFDAQIVRRRVSNTIGLNLKNKRLADLVTRKIQEKIEGYDMMLSVLSQVVEFRNHESGSHVLHIGLITEMMLDCLMKKSNPYSLTYEDAQQIRFASALHDIGKITIPDEIINKPGRLTPEERAVMETHSAAGADLLDQVEGFKGDPMIRRAWEICRWHHERYDGRGYPDGLVGDAIPISAQVVAVADVYDALTSERCYKTAFSHEQAIEMILSGKCGAFSPLLMECLTEIADQLPEKLQKDTIGHKWNRDAARMVDEMSRLGELDVSSKIMFQLQFEQASAEYFKKIVGGYSFSYRTDTDLLIMSPALAKTMNFDEVIHAPSQNEALLSSLNKIGISWHTLRADTSAANPERTIEVTYGEGAQTQTYRCNVRTVWSTGDKPQFLGLVGVVTPD